MQILIGADPEVFVMDNTTSQFVNAEGMVWGTKEDPQPVEHGAVQVDGMALEFNIDPASTEDEFKRNIMQVKKHLGVMIGDERYSLVSQPSVRFSRQVMGEASHGSLMLGCEPDFCAWRDGDVNPAPNARTNLRTGAGHVHIGWTEGADVHDSSHQQSILQVIKQMDASLGLQSLSWDKDNNRRALYGKAGAFRIKPYGCEYRVLSNAWLASEELVGHIFKTAKQSVEHLMAGWEYFGAISNIENIINTGDADAADKALTTLGIQKWEGGYV